MSSAPTAVAVDLGKTRCRAMVDAEQRVVRSGIGSPGLATPNGVEDAVASILPLLDQDAAPQLLGVGAAGAWVAPAAALALAAALAASVRARVAVASDVVTAHAGALGGSPGVLLIAGTGAAALGADADGIRLIDGWGPDIGDLGSGSWLGREAARAVQRATAGLGPDTRLSETVAASILPADDVVTWLAEEGSVARRLGSLAPLVLDAAETGDDVAHRIATEGIRLLTATAVAASSLTRDIALHGGLTDHAWFRDSLISSLHAAGRRVVPAAGDALDGALLIARRTDLPHERFVHRAE
ncbi:N-acetylglucosamine kinase [Microbacterium maritypicum]|uniref:N-acetylglucosamine kinase n=1 Tax=Microbacterium maritypicum TaxID=33918 RepID=UPI003557D954